MKKSKNNTPTNSAFIFGKYFSYKSIFAWTLCSIIGVVMLIRTIYVNQKLSGDVEIVIAEVTEIYYANHGQRLWGYEMKYKYHFQGIEFFDYTTLQDDEVGTIHVGDCIEVIVSLDDKNVQKWNSSKGSFKCPNHH